MKRSRVDTVTDGSFPPPPIDASARIVPITSWQDMFRETEITGVELDAFWLEHVGEGTAYFFRWLGEPRGTVLVVWNDEEPTHIECRKCGGEPATGAELEPVLAEVKQLFRAAGYWSSTTIH